MRTNGVVQLHDDEENNSLVKFDNRTHIDHEKLAGSTMLAPVL